MDFSNRIQNTGYLTNTVQTELSAGMDMRNTLLIDGNTADWGGGIYFAGSLVIDCDGTPYGVLTVSNNTAEYGGGIYLLSNSIGGAANFIVEKNTATYSGAGMYIYFTGEINTNVTVRNNNGHGVYVNSNCSLNGFDIYENTSSGIYANDSLTLNSNCSIYQNNAQFGGGVLFAPGAPADGVSYKVLTINGADIHNNTATDYGGGIYSQDGEVKLISGKVRNNQCQYRGGGVYMKNGKFSCAGVLVTGNFTTNDDSHGGGIFVNSGEALITSGAVISANTTKLTGGGVYCEQNLTITGGVISENQAKDGGAIVCKKTLNISNCEVNQNIATQNGGGILLGWGGTFTITDVIMRANVAGDTGGSVYICDGATGTMTNSEITNFDSEGNVVDSSISSHAKNAGGIYIGAENDDYENIPTLTLTNTIVKGIIASSLGGAIANMGNLTTTSGLVVDSCSASLGGAIANAGDCVIGGATITSCIATLSNGNAIANLNKLTLESDLNLDTNGDICLGALVKKIIIVDRVLQQGTLFVNASSLNNTYKLTFADADADNFTLKLTTKSLDYFKKDKNPLVEYLAGSVDINDFTTSSGTVSKGTLANCLYLV